MKKDKELEVELETPNKENKLKKVLKISYGIIQYIVFGVFIGLLLSFFLPFGKEPKYPTNNPIPASIEEEEYEELEPCRGQRECGLLYIYSKESSCECFHDLEEKKEEAIVTEAAKEESVFNTLVKQNKRHKSFLRRILDKIGKFNCV